jgi:outer membrane murein-binding lipoprotein Lpp
MGTLSSAQVSALSSGIDDLASRVARLATELEESHEAEAAAALYEVERSLLMANRSMDRARRALGY